MIRTMYTLIHTAKWEHIEIRIDFDEYCMEQNAKRNSVLWCFMYYYYHFIFILFMCVCCFVLLYRYWGIVTVPGSIPYGSRPGVAGASPSTLTTSLAIPVPSSSSSNGPSNYSVDNHVVFEIVRFWRENQLKFAGQRKKKPTNLKWYVLEYLQPVTSWVGLIVPRLANRLSEGACAPSHQIWWQCEGSVVQSASLSVVSLWLIQLSCAW